MDQLKILRSIRVLLIEDSPSDVRLIREALRASQLIVHTVLAHDGADALEYLANCKAGIVATPDLILLDLNLPKMSGTEVLRTVKQDAELKKIPVIIITSSSSEEDVANAYDLNANCYIRKPMDFSEYQKVVQAIEDFWFLTVTLPESSPVPAVPVESFTNTPRVTLQ